MATNNKNVKITLVKSTIGCNQKMRATIEALGLKKIGQTREVQATDCVRGMIFKVKHLVSVEEV